MTRYNPTTEKWISLGQGYFYQKTDAGTMLRNSHGDSIFLTGEEEEDFEFDIIALPDNGTNTHKTLKGFFE